MQMHSFLLFLLLYFFFFSPFLSSSLLSRAPYLSIVFNYTTHSHPYILIHTRPRPDCYILSLTSDPKPASLSPSPIFSLLLSNTEITPPPTLLLHLFLLIFSSLLTKIFLINSFLLIFSSHLTKIYLTKIFFPPHQDPPYQNLPH
ncbi:hypothetical protein RchiOBHm_Chr6g0272761 [Rosa chinensis]|uniref:Uncharacterized protein n=1 Tax=Rosa chinensis TaxID=74649 RepID=A0A2P6PRC0_ROSCH|nr:hypothetical protein RchiOBHm_Chr6g0272761 [Rosa chinensis]